MSPGFVASLRLDAAELARSRWPWFCTLVYGTAAGLFLLVGMRESTVLAYTGSGRALVVLTHALLVLVPLLALMASGQAVGGAREGGQLELLMSLPIRRQSWFGAVSLARYVVVVAPLALLLGAVALHGVIVHREQAPWEFLLRCVLVVSSLAWAFTGVGLLVSTLVRNPARAVIWLLVAWVLGIALLDSALAGLMLSWRLEPRTVFVLASINPVQAARLALLASADPDLATLGPVGFWLAHRVGERGLLALGLAWPLAVGTAAWALARAAFVRQDVA